jgi:hypothetical protein
MSSDSGTWTSQITLPRDKKQFFGFKILKVFDADPDPGSGIFLILDPVSGMDKHPGSATLTLTWELCWVCIRKVYSGGAITVERADWPRLSPTAPTTTSTPHPNRSGVQVLLKTNWIRHVSFGFGSYRCFSQIKNQNFSLATFFVFIFAGGLCSFIISYDQIVWYRMPLKGTGSRERIQISWQKLTDLGINKDRFRCK